MTQVKYNPNDVRHVIRKVGDRYTLSSIARVLEVSTATVSQWCAMYSKQGMFPPKEYHARIFALGDAVERRDRRVLVKLRRADGILHPRDNLVLV